MKDKEFMANLNDTESDFEFVEKVKDELEKRGLAAEYKNFVEEIGKEQNPENFGAIAEKYLTKGKEEPKYEIVNDKAIDAIKDNFTPPGAKDEEEYYEDDGGRVYTWGELKKDIDDWVKKPDFGEQFANEDERKGYFNSDSTPNYRKIYKDFWDIGSNGAMSQISKERAKELRDDIDTNNNGEIEVDEMADFQKSLDDYASKNKKGREDIPATYKR